MRKYRSNVGARTTGVHVVGIHVRVVENRDDFSRAVRVAGIQDSILPVKLPYIETLYKK